MKPLFQFQGKLFCIIMLTCCILTRVAAQQSNLLNSDNVIRQHATAIGLSQDDLKNYRVSDAYVDNLSGATLYYLQQTYKGIDVLNSIQTVAIKNNQVLSVAGKRIAQMELKANVKDGLPAVTAENAVRAMARHLNLSLPSFITALKAMDNKKVIPFSDLGISTVPVKSKLIWLMDSKSKKASLSWQVEVQPKGVVDYWLVNVDAAKGAVLSKFNLNVSCSWSEKENAKRSAGYTHNHADNPTVIGETGVTTVNSATYRVIPFPAESPIHPGGTPAVVNNPWELAGAGNAATTLQWHDDGNTTYNNTRGNNVLAQEDKNANNGSGSRATSTTAVPDLTFDFIPDFAQQPTVTVNQNFALTNLFYWNNIMHDLSYQYGFDEVSGNFQTDNLGRGGEEGDYVLADGLDGGSTSDPDNFDNANFSTPTDGGNPRMQMYLWTTSTIRKDGDLDNGVIAHEYSHGISNRLTGGPSTGSCLLIGEQMGEGWSDYIALMTTTDWKTALVTDGTKKRAIGTYVLSQPVTGGGVRRYPYSTDMTIDPWTYAKMKETYYAPQKIYDSHEIGAIWCSALWDLTWDIIQTDGINRNIFDADGAGGNSVVFKLVMEGMKLQPCDPGFIDGRDAILKADTLLYGGKYSCAIWKAFTRRGMGYYASQGNSYYVGDEKADLVSAILSKTANKDSFVQQEQVTYTFNLKSGPCTSVSDYKIVDTLPANVTYVSSPNGTYNAANRTVTFSSLNLGANSSLTRTIIVTVNNGSYTTPVVHMNETVTSNAIPAGWSISSNESNKWTVTGSKTHSAPYAMFIADADSTVLARLSNTTSFTLANNAVLSFWHSYNTEAGWDGGWVEISTNNGVTYTDLRNYIVQNGYQSTVYYTGTTVDSFRTGFSGNSGGFIKTIVDLSSFAGMSVRFRFVSASDELVSGEGWYIDDIYLASGSSGIKNIGQFFSSSNVLGNSSSAYSGIMAGTLPVTWGEFTATKQGAMALLKWQTLQEYNTSHFIIERSSDGEHFHQLTTVSAAGNSSVARTYQFTDKLPLNGKDHYRIVQVDKDGKSSYSPTRTLDFLLDHVITITPNPAKDKLTITVSGNDKSLRLHLISATGQQVKSYDMTGQYLQINLPHIAPGTYYLKIIGDGINKTQKLVIQ